MRWSAKGARKRANGLVVVLGVGGTAALLAFGSTEQAQTRDLSPAEIIATRFPPGWNAAPAPAPPPRALPAPTLATTVPRAAAAPLPTAPAPAPAPAAPESAPAGGVDMDLAARLLFSPQPTYPPSIAAPAGDRAALPEQAMAYADPAAATVPAARLPAAGPVERPAAVPRPPERRAALPARAVKESTLLFNDAQIASIKERLALTADQQRYWPAVASALRAITRQRAHDGAPKSATPAPATATRAAFIDPNSAEVAQLKSAAVPLIMTLREEQKREVRMLAHLMGLESVAAQF
jgi:hypothetical protein